MKYVLLFATLIGVVACSVNVCDREALSPSCQLRTKVLPNEDVSVFNGYVGKCHPSCRDDSDYCYLPRGVPKRHYVGPVDAWSKYPRFPCPGCTIGVDDSEEGFEGPSDWESLCAKPSCVLTDQRTCHRALEQCEMRLLGTGKPCLGGSSQVCIPYFKNELGVNPNVPGAEVTRPAHCDPAKDLSCPWITFENPEGEQIPAGASCTVACNPNQDCGFLTNRALRTVTPDVRIWNNSDAARVVARFLHDDRRVDLDTGRGAEERAGDFILWVDGGIVPAWQEPVIQVTFWDELAPPGSDYFLHRNYHIGFTPAECCYHTEYHKGVKQCWAKVSECAWCWEPGQECETEVADPPKLFCEWSMGDIDPFYGVDVVYPYDYFYCPEQFNGVICNNPDQPECWHVDWIQFALP